MITLSDKHLVSSIFVGAIGLILLGIGIGGLASLPNSIASSMMGPQMMGMMGPQMMGMMGGQMMGQGMGFGPMMGGMQAQLHAYIAMMLVIYIGLITIGSYIIYRAITPIVKLTTPAK